MKACHALAQLGHEVVLVAPGSGPRGETEDEKWVVLAQQYGLETSFQTEFIPPFDGYLARRVFPWRAGLRARTFGPDLVYTWLIQSAVLGLLLGKRVLLELHDVPAGRFGRLWYWLFLRLKGKKRQLVITQALADALKETYGGLPETILAPNGVDLGRYAGLPVPTQARRLLGLPAMPTAACTGHLYEGRGVELFLGLAGALPEIHFLWVGGRPKDVARWRDEADTRGLQNVTFQGFVPNAELPLYQAAADILMMPYQQEVGGSSGAAPVRFFSSMKMVEYMAARRPIISSDLAVIHESLPADSALFCPPDDLDAWASAIRELLADEEQSAWLAGNAFERAKESSWTARARKALKGWS
jgi:glycosyltransferase involved in cell wall biosynthesis